ncbi:hypothetical protein GC173_17475 [bacterium]|nr:hypothetical protein [bacterium]
MRGSFLVVLAVMLALILFVPRAGAEPVRPGDPLLKGVRLSGKGTLVEVPVVSREFLLMDAEGSRRLQFQVGVYNTASSPPIHYRWTTAGGEHFEYGLIFPSGGYSSGGDVWLKSARIGEAVLLKVTCEEFPGDRKTVVTYNAAVRGIAEVDGSSQQLLASEAPPYYNTFPVDAAKHGFQNSTYTPPSTRTGFGAELGLCDSETSPGIGLPYGNQYLNALMADSTTSLTIRSSAMQSWEGILSPPYSDSGLTICAFGWGQDIPGQPGWIFFEGPAPIGEVHLDVTMSWGHRHFGFLDYRYTSVNGSFFNPAPGPALTGPTNAIKDAQVANGVPANYVDAVPNSLQLLEAVDEYLSGRAVLATHLATLCDVNRDGVIDKSDRTALVIDLGLQGTVAY